MLGKRVDCGGRYAVAKDRAKITAVRIGWQHDPDSRKDTCSIQAVEHVDRCLECRTIFHGYFREGRGLVCESCWLVEYL